MYLTNILKFNILANALGDQTSHIYSICQDWISPSEVHNKTVSLKRGLLFHVQEQYLDISLDSRAVSGYCPCHWSLR